MTHEPANPEGERRRLKLRLRRVIGQLNGVERMLDRECECSEILNQLVAARGALKAVAEKVIHEHLQHYVQEAKGSEKGRRSLEELVKVLESYVS